MPLLATLILLTGAAAPAHASPIRSYDGRVVRWDISPASPNLNYYIDPAVGTTYANWSRSAFALWAAVPETYVTFTEVGTEAAADIVIKGYPSIDNNLVPMQAAPRIRVADSTLAGCEAQLTIGTDTAAEYATPSGQNYLESGVIHEIGHCLGLPHSIVAGAVMSYRARSPLTLAADDRFAIALLYPRDGQTEYPLGCAGLARSDRSSGPRGGGPGGNLGEFLALLMILGATYLAARRGTPVTARYY